MVLPLLAPLLATLASNGLGLVADAVTKKGQQYVEEKLGIDLTQKPTPEALAQWQEAARAHEKELISMVFEDRANARAREVELATSQNAPLLNKVVTPALALGVVALSFALFAVLIFVNVDIHSKDILIYILGVLSAAVTQILSYYFGSSDGSKQKDGALESLARK
jgi:hypothetical protein